MAYEFYVTIEGTKQGAFKGESMREAHSAKLAGLTYKHTIQSPRDAATGRASGKRQHGQITFTKEWGPASPQLMQALCTNELLPSVLFEFIKTTDDGQEEIYHTIKLVNATVAKIDYITGGAGGEGVNTAKHQSGYDTHELEAVALTYQRIEMENRTGSTMAEDDWTQ